MSECITNADYIRNMTDKELSVWMCGHIECDNCPVNNMLDRRTIDDKCNKHMTCTEANLLFWLSQIMA